MLLIKMLFIQKLTLEVSTLNVEMWVSSIAIIDLREIDFRVIYSLKYYAF